MSTENCWAFQPRTFSLVASVWVFDRTTSIARPTRPLGNSFSAAQREDAAEVAQRAISEALGMEMPVEVVAREARPGGVSQKLR